MKGIWLGLVCAVAMAGAQAPARDVTGTWQGTLAAGKGLRTVVKIAKDDGVLKSVFYSIDQGGQPIPVSRTTLNGSALTLRIDALDLVYEGKFDGNTITGTSTQGGHSFALNLTRATPETAWTIPEPPAKLAPMAKDADPAFEVATIKPSKPDAQGRLYNTRPRKFITFNTSLSNLINFAYGLHVKQIVGGPAWMDEAHFDLEVQPDGEGQPSAEQWKTILKKLLADRFQLKFHYEKRELPVFALVVAQTGPKLTPSDGDPKDGGSLLFRALGVLPGQNVSMAEFANVMQSAVLDRPVVDETGLTGRYNFLLKWTPDDSQFGGLGIKVPPSADGADQAPPLFTAIQEQLGLKLEATRAPVEVMVVDKAEKPSEN